MPHNLRKSAIAFIGGFPAMQATVLGEHDILMRSPRPTKEVLRTPRVGGKILSSKAEGSVATGISTMMRAMADRIGTGAEKFAEMDPFVLGFLYELDKCGALEKDAVVRKAMGFLKGLTQKFIPKKAPTPTAAQPRFKTREEYEAFKTRLKPKPKAAPTPAPKATDPFARFDPSIAKIEARLGKGKRPGPSA